ncbi:amidohydrolase family protein [Defluviitalea raffinosedens]|uniref:Amidohydrolase family protein n=1 Tax=Defluviitalea raffinosedens TaxID=1450156 RepID=A0A7C8LAV4_9FIRM|nr:amidohydrolase family protein [Defluviitalea raffinosedens]KAE9628371.1 amidohydrolase family protein [Defluviitalea raffinosedens]
MIDVNELLEESANNTEESQKKLYTDYHMHLMSKQMADIFKVLNGSDQFNENPIEEFSAERILTLLDHGRLNRAFVLSGAYMLGMDGIEGPDEYNDVKKENNYLAIQCAKDPERLIGFFSVNPLKSYAIKEVDRCYDRLRLPGLKLHFTNSKVDLNNPEHLAKIQEIFSHAAKRGIPILLHFRRNSPEFGKKDVEILINEVIVKTPGLKLQIAHLGGWGGFDETTEEVISTFIEEYEKSKGMDKSSIIFDLSGVIVTQKEEIKGMLDITSEEQHKRIIDYIREWGIENIVFGSDWPYSSPADYISNSKRLLPLKEAEIEKILTNDICIRMFGSSEIRHPDLKQLLMSLKEGIDYNASLSVKLGE